MVAAFHTVTALPVDERRTWPRILLDATALLRFDRIGPEIHTRLVNVSAKGLFLAMDSVRPLGTRIRITVRIDEVEEEIAVAGVVVHVEPEAHRDRPAGIGVFLTDVGHDWLRFCRRLARSED